MGSDDRKAATEADPTPGDRTRGRSDKRSSGRASRRSTPPRSRETGELTNRALNRALLERQLLVARSERTPLSAVEHLAGMQAQAPQAPFVGLWSRLRNFHPDDLGALLTGREVVRMAMMRSTVHLITAADALSMRPLFQNFLARGLRAAGWGPEAADVDLAKVAAVGRALLEERPRTNPEIRAHLLEYWPDHDPTFLTLAVRNLLPCVQVPPRGLWGTSGQPVLTTTQAWLGRPEDPEPSPERLVLRYLTAYGPATVQDMQTWSGLTRLGEIFERLRPNLRTYRAEDGRELFDLPDGPLPDPETPVPVRFLPEYDNCLRSHADRGRVIPEDARPALASKNDSPRPTFLVDGYVRGTWKLERGRTRAALVLVPFRPLSKRHTAEVTSEAARLLEFVAPTTGDHDVRLSTPD